MNSNGGLSMTLFVITGGESEMFFFLGGWEHCSLSMLDNSLPLHVGKPQLLSHSEV